MKHIVETHVCVGGPLDRQHVVRDGEFFRVSGNAGVATYLRKEIAGERQAFSVWVYEHTSPDQALEYLLNAYENTSSAADARSRWQEMDAGRGVLQVLLSVVKASPGQELSIGVDVLENLRLEDRLTTVLQPDGGLHLKIS